MIHSDVFAHEIAMTTKTSSKNFLPISRADALTLDLALIEDAKSIAHASLASLFEGINGLEKERFNWAIVKLYYSAFYSCRAILMLRSFSVFYIGRSPYALLAKAGETVTQKSGNTHTVVMTEFKNRFSADELLSQDIDSKGPLSWLEDRRNHASYKSAPFTDPTPPPEFVKSHSKLRSHIRAYLGADRSLYAFDPDHAMIAFPLWLLARLSRDLQLVDDKRIDVSKHYSTLLATCFVPELRVALSSFRFD